MGRVVIEHLSGSKSGQTEYFEIDTNFKEIVIGRDDTSNIKYDPDRDDLVGRQHAKITRDEQDINKFVVLDLNSRNGTFVNNQRISSKTTLWNGDKVQFGVGGPELVFKLDPPPLSSGNGVKSTRISNGGNTGKVSETRQVEVPTSNSAITGPRSVFGKRTVEIMLQQVRGEGRKNLFLFGGAIVVIIALVSGIFGYYFWQSRKSQEQALQDIAKKLSPAKIAEMYGPSVVYIEASWKLMNTATSNQVYQRGITSQEFKASFQEYVVSKGIGIKEFERVSKELDPYFNKAEESIIEETKEQKIVKKTFPAFLRLSNGTIEPWLVNRPTEYPIGGQPIGSGFIITSNGYILTNRHVATPWTTAYSFEYDAGLLYDITSLKMLGIFDPKANKIILFPDENEKKLPGLYQWVPEATRQGVDTNASFKAITDKKILKGEFRGINDRLEVSFSKNTLATPARISRISDRQDITMIKIDLPESVKPVEMNDNYETITVGDSVTTLGYPGITPQSEGYVESKELSNRETIKKKFIPDPTFSKGDVGNIIRGDSLLSREAKQDKRTVDFSYAQGDAYQLTINSTGAGNSGGPVFDEQGRVIGIFTYGATDGFARVTYAIPIRYGIELMGTGNGK